MDKENLEVKFLKLKEKYLEKKADVLQSLIRQFNYKSKDIFNLLTGDKKTFSADQKEVTIKLTGEEFSTLVKFLRQGQEDDLVYNTCATSTELNYSRELETTKEFLKEL